MSQCERCGHHVEKVGPDGYCDPCAARLKESEEGGEAVGVGSSCV